MKYEIYAFTRGFKALIMSITGSQKPGILDTRAFELPSASQCIWLTLHSIRMLKQIYINQAYLIRLVCDFP